VGNPDGVSLFAFSWDQSKTPRKEASVTSPQLWYVNVFVSDLKRAVEFYRDTLGLPLQFQEEQFGYASFAPEGVRFGVARVDANAPDAQSLLGRHTGIGWGVPDLNAAYQNLKTKGVRFTMAPTKQPWGGFMTTFSDPDGNLFYLDQLRA
jgi:predicted enzyme related to lactoylglutathione lyase